MISVSFTGTRKGMTPAQTAQLHMVLGSLRNQQSTHANEFHHGAAEGADSQAETIARSHGWFTVAHPAGEDPLARNRLIVACGDILIAAPSGDKEQLRSGTWATVRYARAAGKPVIMLSRAEVWNEVA